MRHALARILGRPGLALILGAALAGGAAAQSNLPVIVAPEEEATLRPLATTDAIRGFEAIGRLDTGDGFCTATLIAPDLILTAAHCLFREDGVTRRPDSAFIFNAGLRNGRVAAQRGIRRSFLHPDYETAGGNDLDRVRSDLALLRLDRAIPASLVRPIAPTGGVERGDAVQVVSYGAAREDYASLEEDCEVLAGDPGVLVLSCEVVQGASGSPVMVRGGDGLRIASVVSAQARWRGDQVALSAELDGRLETLTALAQRQGANMPTGLPQVRTLTGSEDGRSSSGARFIRP